MSQLNRPLSGSNFPLPLAARTASPGTGGVVGAWKNPDCKGIELLIHCTAAGGTGFTVEVDALDAQGGVYQELISAAITGAGDKRLVIYPGITVAANLAAAMVLGEYFQIKVTHSDATSCTYSVQANLLK